MQAAARRPRIEPSGSRPAHPRRRAAARLPARRPARRAADRLALQCLAHAGAGGVAPADRAGRRQMGAGQRLSARHRPATRALPPPICRAPRRTSWPSAILRDRVGAPAGRDGHCGRPVAALSCRRRTVLKCAKETIGGGNWSSARPASPGCSGRRHDGPDALAESYEFRLMLEPAACWRPASGSTSARRPRCGMAWRRSSRSPDAAFDIGSSSASTSSSTA